MSTQRTRATRTRANKTKANGTRTKRNATKARTRRAPVNSNKIMTKLQSLLEKYNRAYELVQKKMAACEQDLKLLDEYMKREAKAKEEYDAYAERYRAILEGAGTRI
jgi:hypothetical protein